MKTYLALRHVVAAEKNSDAPAALTTNAISHGLLIGIDWGHVGVFILPILPSVSGGAGRLHKSKISVFHAKDNKNK